MGIPSLFSALSPWLQECNLYEDFSHKRVGIDASVWIWTIISRYYHATTPSLLGESVVQEFVDQVLKLEDAEINVFVVFDGVMPDGKLNTVLKRKEHRIRYMTKQVNKATLEQKEDELLSSKAHIDNHRDISNDPVKACQKGAICSPSSKNDDNLGIVLRKADTALSINAMQHQVILLLQKHNIRCIFAPYEADHQLVHLVRCGIVDAVISSDSDFLVHNVPLIRISNLETGKAQVFVPGSRPTQLCQGSSAFKQGSSKTSLVSLAGVVQSILDSKTLDCGSFKESSQEWYAQVLQHIALSFALIRGNDYATMESIGDTTAMRVLRIAAASACTLSDLVNPRFLVQKMFQIAQPGRMKLDFTKKLLHEMERARALITGGIIFHMTFRVCVPLNSNITAANEASLCTSPDYVGEIVTSKTEASLISQGIRCLSKCCLCRMDCNFRHTASQLFADRLDFVTTGKPETTPPKLIYFFPQGGDMTAKRIQLMTNRLNGKCGFEVTSTFSPKVTHVVVGSHFQCAQTLCRGLSVSSMTQLSASIVIVDKVTHFLTHNEWDEDDNRFRWTALQPNITREARSKEDKHTTSGEVSTNFQGTNENNKDRQSSSIGQIASGFQRTNKNNENKRNPSEQIAWGSFPKKARKLQSTKCPVDATSFIPYPKHSSNTISGKEWLHLIPAQYRDRCRAWNDNTSLDKENPKPAPHQLPKDNLTKRSDDIANMFESPGRQEKRTTLLIGNNKTAKFWSSKSKHLACQKANSLQINLNEHLTNDLEKLQRYFEVQGDEWRAMGYKKSSQMLRRLRFRVTDVSQVRNKYGIGKSSAEKIDEILQTGYCAKAMNLCRSEEYKAEETFCGIYGVGPKIARKLWARGFRSIQDIRRACSNPSKFGRVLDDPRQQVGLRLYEELQQRIPRDEVKEIGAVVEAVAKEVYSKHSATLVAELCGSYRRGKGSCGDVDVIITASDIEEHLPLTPLINKLHQIGFLTDHLALPKNENLAIKAPDKVKSSYMGVCKLSRKGAVHRRIDIKSYQPDHFGFAVLYFTGSDHFNRSMRFYAKKLGYTLSDVELRPAIRTNGNRVASGKSIPCYNERQIFEKLGLEYRAPQDRNCGDLTGIAPPPSGAHSRPTL